MTETNEYSVQHRPEKEIGKQFIEPAAAKRSKNKQRVSLTCFFCFLEVGKAGMFLIWVRVRACTGVESEGGIGVFPTPLSGVEVQRHTQCPTLFPTPCFCSMYFK